LQIRQQLRPPVIPVRLWLRTIDATSVLMPKTSMNENSYAVSWQDDIWFTGQIAPMQAISVTKRR
jgi:hypothetical protein